MSWRLEKTDGGQDLVFDSLEQGIGVSALKGTANIQNANIATETGEALASYKRTNEAQVAISAGTLTASIGDGATLLAAPATLKAGAWIKVTASSITSITATTGATTASTSYLVVGGGGGGGQAFSGTIAAGGGGGAGGFRTGSLSVSATSYPITVGNGGAGGTIGSGSTGGDSIFSTITSTGGGGGAGGQDPVSNAGNGGSGGGGSGEQTSGTAGTAGTGTGGQGNNGGAGRSAANAAGGGGGGATAAGAASVASAVGGAGGAGTASTISGLSVTYAGGGGGGGGTPGAGGAGGGGAGGTADGNDGTANRGGGGGGATSTGVDHDGGDGGSGVVIISYTTGDMVAFGGGISYKAGKTIHTFTSSGAFTVVWVNPGGYYYVSYQNTSNKIKLSAKFDPAAANALTHGTSGTATFDTVATPGSALAKATEPYATATAQEYRYYILDVNGFVWVYDTAVYDSSLAASGVATTWMLPDPVNYSAIKFTGMAVINGWLVVVSNSRIAGKKTVDLGNEFGAFPNVTLNEPFPTHTNFALVGTQGKMYYGDGNYVGMVFPTTSLITSIANVQSYCSYTASTTTMTVTSVINGSLPYGQSTTRIPVVFFTDVYGTLPTAVVEGTIYYLQYSTATSTFTAYTALTEGSTVDTGTGAVGTQYFNTFYPISTDAGVGGTNSTLEFQAQRLNLPAFETVQAMVELGNTIIIGCNGNTLYPWNQVDATPSDVIALPEGDVRTMVNVNNMGFVFAGNKGNIYITNNSVASGVFKVPDYCAGVPGTPLTYIEPYFTWGDAAYLRGRVYFSILDQTAAKAGNTGGIWSFIPSQNFSYGQDTGLSLRLENQNSYGDYDGVATIILPNQEQKAISPQYWAAWQDSYSTATSVFGIDNTGTVPVTTFVIETDLLVTGSLLSKDTFAQLEYKLTTPLATGDSVQLYYRKNATDAWASCGTVKVETLDPISGYFDINFEKTQWVQFRAVCTTVGTTASSFVRFKEIRLR